MLGTTTTTNAYITELLTEIDGFDPDLYPPKDKIAEGEKVLATITDPYLKKLYAITSHYMREAARTGLECKLDDDVNDESEMAKEFSRLHIRHELCAELFWACLKAHHNLYGLGLGIRKDWAIVKRPEPKQNGGEILKKIFGVDLD